MSAAQRGLTIFVVVLIMAAVFCWAIPSKILPGQGIAMALPVIQLPGEVLSKDFPVLGELTNTIVALVIVDILVLLIAFRLRSPAVIPGRFQSLIELITDYLYGMTKQVAGVQHAGKIFPLVGTIFLVVLLSNWLGLLPGVDSIGLMHCAEEGKKGYPITSLFNGDEPEAPFDGVWAKLKVTKTLDAGTVASLEDYHACEAKWFGITEHEGAEEEHAVESTEPGAESTETGEAGTEGTEESEADTEAAADEEHGEEATEGIEGTAAAVAEAHVANPDLLVVTPFVRGASTDINFTLALALISVFSAQYFGVQALGVAYFYKFINLPALGNAGKNPMGLMDFGVGILELISEISKIISFSFRLLGNLFAGLVLFVVIPFLVATLLPVAIYGLEMFVGIIQAFVFFMLTLVFARLAMEGHGGHDEHEEEHAHH